MRKKLSSQEFSQIMKERHKKEMEKYPGKTPIVVGSLFPSKTMGIKSKLVECCRCGIPLYVTDWVYDETVCYFVPWDDSKHPFFCQFCVPMDLLVGAYLQNIAFIEKLVNGETK